MSKKKKKQVTLETNLYDLNKTMMQQLPFLESAEQIESVVKLIKEYFLGTNACYYMLLNHERKDFTLFNFNKRKQEEDIVFEDLDSGEEFTTCSSEFLDSIKEQALQNDFEQSANDIIICFVNRGFGLVHAERNNDGAFEFWVKDKINNDTFVYMLFPYDLGVLEY